MAPNELENVLNFRDIGKTINAFAGKRYAESPARSQVTGALTAPKSIDPQGPRGTS
jgi:hypothetical protein